GALRTPRRSMTCAGFSASGRPGAGAPVAVTAAPSPDAAWRSASASAGAGASSVRRADTATFSGGLAHRRCGSDGRVSPRIRPLPGAQPPEVRPQAGAAGTLPDSPVIEVPRTTP